MSRVVGGITASIDGFVAGPDDGPGCGLGIGGERLHHWVFGGEWHYGDEHRGEPTGEDRAFLDETMGRNGAVICGRGTYEASGHWGGSNPFGVPLIVVTHRPEDAPHEGGFTFVDGLERAIDEASVLAGERQVFVMGGADVLRQSLATGRLEEFTLILAPVLLGRGKRLFGDMGPSRDLRLTALRRSAHATFLTYEVHAG